MVAGSVANRKRSAKGMLSTRWRSAAQPGQKPRRLQLKATSRSAWQAVQRTLKNPCANRPLQVILELPMHVSGQRPALRAEFCHEGRVLAFDQLIEKSRFRTVAFVARRAGEWLTGRLHEQSLESRHSAPAGYRAWHDIHADNVSSDRMPAETEGPGIARWCWGFVFCHSVLTTGLPPLAEGRAIAHTHLNAVAQAQEIRGRSPCWKLH